MNPRDVADQLESVEVWTGDELEGYALIDRRRVVNRVTRHDPRILTPVRATRSGAWTDAADVLYLPGIGLRYRPGLTFADPRE